jgi:hypothetical protein
MPRKQLIAELKRLSPRGLKATLAVFGPAEREQVLAMLHASQPIEAILSFEALSGLSPWLLKAADRIQAEGKGGAPSMTPAARGALAEAFAKLAATQAPQAPNERKAHPRWPTLLRRQNRERPA